MHTNCKVLEWFLSILIELMRSHCDVNEDKTNKKEQEGLKQTFCHRHFFQSIELRFHLIHGRRICVCERNIFDTFNWRFTIPIWFVHTEARTHTRQTDSISSDQKIRMNSAYTATLNANKNTKITNFVIYSIRISSELLDRIVFGGVRCFRFDKTCRARVNWIER